jgi:hypothetical protein
VSRTGSVTYETWQWNQLFAWRREFVAQDVDQGLDGEFNEEKRFGDEIIAAGHHGTRAIIEIVQTGDKYHGRALLMIQVAEAGAEFKPAHAGHIDI